MVPKQEYKELRNAATVLLGLLKGNKGKILSSLLSQNLWTDRQAMLVYRTLSAYAVNLALTGINVKKLPVPELSRQFGKKKIEFSKPAKEVTLIYDESWCPIGFGVVFPFHEGMKEEIKQVAGKLWIGDHRFWFIPLSAKKELKDFCLKWDFPMTSDIETVLNMKENKPQVGDLVEIFSSLD